MRSSLVRSDKMAEERTPEEEERFRRFAEGLKERPKGVRAERIPILILLVAILGAFASSMASGGGFRLENITMENFTVSTGPITMSGQMTLQKVDNQDIWVQEASEMRIKNLHIRKVDAQGVLEIKASEVRGTGGYLEVVALFPISENDVGKTFDLETFLGGITKIENLQVIRMHADTQTLYGMEVSIS